jgi:hypothetical protein
MTLEVILFRDSVRVVMTTPYQPTLFVDYMVQAREIAYPFFTMGYHLIHARLLKE